MAAAIAVAPDTEQISTTRVVEQLQLVASKEQASSDSGYLIEERVQRGDTVSSLLARLNILDTETSTFVLTNPEARIIGEQLAPGKIVSAIASANGELIKLHFPLNDRESALVIENRDGKLTAKQVAERFEKIIVSKAGEISSSLFAASDAANIPDAIAIQLAELFGSDIDFHRDLRIGDRFSIAYEMDYLRGQATRSGKILSAEFVNNGKTYRAVWFEQSGKGNYYTPEGKPLKKAFLRSPLEFSRITSSFSMRFHPILKEWRAHQGVDYGAPQGTKVRATADAIVDFAGFQKGYGNIVILKHARSHSTAYGHLQSIEHNVRKGVRINQGETIGRVGQTGWATGPHLHYEFRVNDRPVNPLSASLPVSTPLESSQLGRFKAETAPLLGQLDLLGQSKIAYVE
ncbi:M23 family metallopeptidase [Dechloromonas denitrificans]|uniref:M23 family metallopeptidase n=1 Tax=Dechloromonas denitrificans TaxID=281362 RepID=UPI001CF88742|nr:M23 family metallopeptidase [Dechloromonas denitrificans]UCV02934.1 M23 family metallopeptidase [Dechloromonas denitrificans]